MMKKYTLGLDYGTLSVRALLLDMENGNEVAVAEYVYPHAVMGKETFPEADDSIALQHPQDYLDGLQTTAAEVMRVSGIRPEQVCGIGIDFTACTALPVTADGTPLCFLDAYKNNPHAYVKLWKSHSAQFEADRITEVARKRNEPWLDLYSGRVSSEWLFSKLYETQRKAPDVYRDTVHFLEAADWLVWLMTGQQIRSSSFAGFKGLWNPRTGYPSNDFGKEVDPALDGIIGTKICENVRSVGTFAGTLNEYGSRLLGLPQSVAVAVPIIDAHSPLCTAGMVTGGKMLMILGTSACHIAIDEDLHIINGILGSVEEGIIPGYVAYEGGQPSMGDTFAWFVNNCVPEAYTKAAREQGKSIFTYLNEKASELGPGANGHLVIDWWNGNRVPYCDFDLSGVILGLTLKSKPEELYRAIVESCAFAARNLLELYQNGGLDIQELYAGGGISRKNPLLMQIFADTLGMDIKVTDSTQAGSKGSAIFAAAACGYYPSLEAAAAALADRCETVYHPNTENLEAYSKLYKEYITLCKYFAEGDNDVMKRLLDK